MSIWIAPRSIASQWVCILVLCIQWFIDKLTVIKLVLDPRCKLKYFKMAKWEKEWIDKAEWLTRQEYIKLYRDLEAEFAELSIVLAAQAQKQVSTFLINIDTAKPGFRTPQYQWTCLIPFLHSQGWCLLLTMMNFLDTFLKMSFQWNHRIHLHGGHPRRPSTLTCLEWPSTIFLSLVCKSFIKHWLLPY